MVNVDFSHVTGNFLIKLKMSKCAKMYVLFQNKFQTQKKKKKIKWNQIESDWIQRNKLGMKKLLEMK